VKRILWIIVLTGLTAVGQALAVNVNDTRMLSQPAIGKTHIAFIYAGDLWVADHDGKNVRRLTTDPGSETNPAFSPDGSLIAFGAQYEGNTDVYVVSVSGGVPKRLTWHPGPDLVQGFAPDGKAVLFASPRNSFNDRYWQLYKVNLEPGFPEQLEIPNGQRATYSPDGTRLAYNPLSYVFGQWKHYRGGTHAVISLYKFSDHSIQRIPQPQGGCNDADPMWMGDTVYFRSDRNGEFNLFSFDLKTQTVKPLTQHQDFPVLYASSGDGKIVYEQAGYLHLLDPKKSKSQKITIGIPADLLELRPRYAKGVNFVRSVSLSPTGARVVMSFRGEVVTLPAEKGDARNLTNTVGVHDRDPVWSPDGKQIAYFSDEGARYMLHVRSQDGKGDIKKIALNGAGFYNTPVWSPDSRKISYVDNSYTLYWLDIAKATTKKISSEPYYGPSFPKVIQHTWSPDSKWLAYTRSSKSWIHAVLAYSIEQDKSFPITDGLSDVGEPVFDASGKYLYFFGSTDAGPIVQWFDMSNADMRRTRSLYLAVLRKEYSSPLAKESDEEKGISKGEKNDKKETDKEKSEKDKGDTSKEETDTNSKEVKKNEPFSIDFDGLNNRIVAIPLPAADYSDLQAGNDGQIFYIERREGSPGVQPGDPGGPQFTLHKYDLNKRKDEVLLSNVMDYDLSGDKKKLFYRFRDNFYVISATEKPEPGKGKLNVESIEVRIDPPTEWAQIFDEVWRINRDYFYAPNMHGVNWPAVKQKYEAFLPDLATRSDLNRVIQWLCSELAVGHSYSGGGDFLNQSKTVPGGLLGADYSIENGRYRFKKVYGGLNWTPDLRAPLTEPGVDVKAGEYLLAVRGQDLRPPTNLHSLFENTSGKLIEITIGPNPDGTGSRTVSVVPIANEATLRNRDWVEGNLRKVEEATGGRVAYVYVPNTTNLGHTYFKRYFFPQAHKEAIIVDERFNGGGQVADYYIDLLRRRFIAYWATRYGADFKTPGASIQGPKVMLIDETAGSGGDLLPWMFRRFKLGKLVGKRTWGGLVGILGFPVLMDGGVVSAPNLAFWTEEDGWAVENVGVPPDVEVEQTPAELIKGRDPQLEEAIQLIMEELKKNPPHTPKRPAYPVKVKQTS
jgi:tricorn protease